ncbi:MAG TPA: DUF2079 domain-containing protein [Candidatus Luteococcus avicola]|nr:DUF2079 domain-containing protein [Candidatus Luteococcus avicola]
MTPSTRVPRVWWLTLAVLALYVVYTMTRYPQFLTAGYDLGIFDQAVRQYSHFNPPYVALKGDRYNLLGDHFHPVLALLAPLYWVWDDPRMLVLAQDVLVAVSIPVVHGFVRRHLGGGWRTWVVTLGYALAWPVQRMIDFDFHEIAFAMPLLAIALDGLDRRSDRRLLLGALPLLLVREDMGMVVLLLGVVRALLAWRDARAGVPQRWGRTIGLAVFLAAIGSVVFVLVTTVVLPHFAPSGEFAYWTYDALGPDAPSAIRFILSHPLRTAGIFFTPWVKSFTLVWLLLPLAFLPLGSPYALVTLPLLAQRFLSSRTHLWTTQFHYNAPIFLILLFAAVDTIGRLPNAARDWRRIAATAMAAMMVAVPVIDPAVRMTNTPLIRLFWSAWHTKPIMRDQQAMVALIPAGTCVEVDDRLAPHLTRSNRVTLPTLTRRMSDFIVLDLSQKQVGYPLPSPQQVQADALARGYTQVASSGPLIMLQRPDYAGPTQDCTPTSP